MTDKEQEEDKNKPQFNSDELHNIQEALEGEYIPAPRPGPGRPKGSKDSQKFPNRGKQGHHPTDVQRQTVLMHMALGTSQSDVAKLMHVSLKTLKRHYKEELNFGRSKANAGVAGKLFDKAMKGDTSAQIFWLKTQAGWREKQDVNFGSEDGTFSPVNKVQIEVIGEDKEGDGKEAEKTPTDSSNVTKLR